MAGKNHNRFSVLSIEEEIPQIEVPKPKAVIQIKDNIRFYKMKSFHVINDAGNITDPDILNKYYNRPKNIFVIVSIYEEMDHRNRYGIKPKADFSKHLKIIGTVNLHHYFRNIYNVASMTCPEWLKFIENHKNIL